MQECFQVQFYLAKTCILLLGQVVNVLREAAAAPAVTHRRTLTHHITIPAAYQSGITFFIRKDSKGYRQLVHYHELS